MRKSYLLLLVVAMLAAAACGTDAAEKGSGAPEEPTAVAEKEPNLSSGRHTDCTTLTQQATVELVAVDNNAYAPDCLIIKSDALLKIHNVGFREHSFTVSKGDFGTAPWLFNLEVKGGKTEDSIEPIGEFLELGTYEFFCKFHAGMDGTIEVVEPVG
jgi:plastocyanin